MKYIIEHMDNDLWEWSVIEYRHAAEHVGKENLIVTNVKQAEHGKLAGCCEVKSVRAASLGLTRVCVLDPAAEQALEPGDAEKFDYLVFGGILGSEKPEGRTRELAVPGSERRNLGKDQLATDNAVMAAKIVVGGKRLAELEFIKDFTVKIEEGEEIILPFKYLVADGKPFVAEELVEHIKKEGF